MARKDDMKTVREALIAQGFTVEPVKNGHWQVTTPRHVVPKRKIQIPATPRNNRGVLNAVTRLKRIGFVPTKKW